jgi:hypothetical protein
MLITRPNHDLTTSYLYWWSEKILDVASKKKKKIIDLKGKQANRKEFINILRKVNPNFIVVNGHGSKDCVTGFNNEILIKAKDNEKELSGKVIFARSCQAANVLGKVCIKTGTKTFIGFKDDFIFFIDKVKENKPLEDKTASLFLEPSNYLVILLLEGCKAGIANNRSKAAYQQNIQKLMTSETPKEDRELIPFVRWDMINQVCLGDNKATIQTYD